MPSCGASRETRCCARPSSRSWSFRPVHRPGTPDRYGRTGQPGDPPSAPTGEGQRLLHRAATVGERPQLRPPPPPPLRRLPGSQGPWPTCSGSRALRPCPVSTLARPLWQVAVLVDGMADGKSAMVVKLHHTIADGIGLLKRGMALRRRGVADFPARPATRRPSGARPRADGSGLLARGAMSSAGGSNWPARLLPAAASRMAYLAVAPVDTVRQAGEMAGSFGRLLTRRPNRAPEPDH